MTVASAVPRQDQRAGKGLRLRAFLAAGLLGLGGSAPAQTTLVTEGFEGAFPGSWSTGDPTQPTVYWKDVNNSVGTVAAHTGFWKGYCAGIGYGGTAGNPTYANNMTAFMSRPINFAGYSGANLSFWLNIPSIETCCDRFGVYMDTTQLYQAGAATAGWMLVTLPLNAYLGGTHTLKFEFDSDFSVVFEGAYLDDILVDAANQPFALSLQSLQNANYSGYVLDSDTVLGRSNVQAQAVFAVENFTGTNTLFTNVLSFRLINAISSTAHPIYDLGNTATNASYTYNLTNVLSLAAGTNAIVTNVAAIRPAAWMSQFMPFYLECRMLTNGALAQTLTTAPQTFYHFTNTASSDTAYNVLLNLTGAAWSRTYAVQTINGQNTFQVNANYEVRRWDDLGLAVAATNVPILFNYTLADAAGNGVPLVSSNQVFFDSVDSYNFLFPFAYPTFLSNSRTLDIQPAGQLDSVNKTYYLTVTISHTNNPASGQVLTANTRLTSTNELLHFDGNLFFGSVGATITNLGSAPPANPPGGGVIATTLNPVGGYVTALPVYTYLGANLNVNLQANGDAIVTGGSTTLSGPSPDHGNVARVNFKRGPVTLSSSGASSDLTVTLPTGFGYRLNDTNSPVIYSTVPFLSVPLDASFVPASDLVYLPAGSTIYAAEESKPVWLAANQIVWHVSAGTFDLPPAGTGPYYVRAGEYAYLSSVSNNLVDPPNMGDKRSNDKYWLNLIGQSGAPTIGTDTGSNALLTATFNFGRGSFRTHFPYDTVVQWSATGVMNVTNDLVPVGSGSALSGATTVAVPYSRECSGCNCLGGGTATPAITVTNGQLTFTLDGGLVATGTNLPVDLQWGYACSPVSDYAQQALHFTDAAFHMPGVFVRGDQNLLPTLQGPTTILYSGFQASNLNLVERPLSFAYSQGLADYAGLNFRCVSNSLHGGRSTIAGQNNINWQLDGRSKYYVRAAGVTGIHEAVPGTFPSNLSLWGYAFTFTSYGLSYIASENRPQPNDSVVDGAVTLPYPAQFQQNFSNMTFSCTGAPLGFDLPPNEGFKTMGYWVADFKTLSMTFQTTNGCAPGAGYLVLGIQGFASHVPQPLYGTVGFFANGDQIPPSFGLPGVTSRLKLPNVITMDGPNKSTYSFTPVQDAYYNTYTNSPPGPTAGWLGLFGKLPVPFFEDLQLHLQTSCHTNGVAASNAPIYLSGGWPRPGTANNNYGWLDPSSRTPFETNLFDADNLGWPGSGGGLTIANYRDNQTGALYHPRAQQLWLNLIPFDYPLSWNTTLRSFKSWQEVTNELFILKVQHQIKYMDARQAEIDFGAQYDGLPTISIANLAFNAIDESTGVGDAIAKAAAQPVEDVLSSGLDKMNQLLDTQMKRMMDGVFDKTVDPIIDQFYNAISNEFTSLPQPQRLQFVLNVQTNTTNFFIGGGPNPAPTTLTMALHDLGNGANQASNLVGQIRGYLHEATNAIQSVVGVITTTTNGQPLGSPIVGLVAMQGGTRPIVPKLMQSLVGDLAPQFINAVVGPAVSNAMQELEPPLAQITDTLNQTRDALSQVDTQLANAGEFTKEIAQILDARSNQLAQVSVQVSLSVTQYFSQFNYSIDDPFQHVSAADLKQFIRQKVEDQFFSTDASAQIQTALRQRLYDVDAAMKGQIDSVFQQINGALRSLISQSLAQVDNSINKCLGDVSDVLGAGKLNGHALIDGDSLKELRIDGHFQFKVPDDMEFDAFLLIKELSSDGSPGGCASPSGKFREVTIGATHVPVSWVSPGMTADAEAKFTFDGTTPLPVNLAGQLALNGELDFEAFQLHDLAAALAFGKFENYIALKGGVKFDGYDFAGAIFFGHTCTLDPIKLIDPQVADVLGNPPFTGAYCFAQGWLPVSELVLDIPPSCVFEISAGVGAGAFFFAEGPTYGGKIFLGVSGQLLCIVSIEGDITLVGAATGLPPGDLRFKGHGHFEADLGPCPFCLKLSKDVDIRYHVPSDWHIDF